MNKIQTNAEKNCSLIGLYDKLAFDRLNARYCVDISYGTGLVELVAYAHCTMKPVRKTAEQ